MNDFFPIILGSDENAYGNARLIKEKYGIKPLLLCKRILIPTRHSRIVEYKTIENFDKESVFPDALLSVLTEYKKKYSRIVVIPCSDYYSMLMSKYYDCFEGLVSNKFIPYSLFKTLDTKDKFYELCDKCVRLWRFAAIFSGGVAPAKAFLSSFSNAAGEIRLSR